MKNKRNWNIRRIIPLFLLLLILGIASIAIYTNQGYKKGVAITEENKALFSSDILEQLPMASGDDTSKFQQKDVRISVGSGDTVTASFSVYNYAPNTPTKQNPNDITYTLQAEIQSADGSAIENLESYQINNTSFDRGTNSLSISDNYLKSNTVSTNAFTITMPESAVGTGITFVIKAIPGSSSINAVNSTCLVAVVTPTRGETGTVPINNTWSGHWVEKTAAQTQTALKPSDCAAFNYELSGTGTGTLILTWPEGLDMDTKSKTLGEVNGNSITIAVDSDICNTYTIQFYRTGEDLTMGYPADSFTSWTNELVSYIPSEDTGTTNP